MLKKIGLLLLICFSVLLLWDAKFSTGHANTNGSIGGYSGSTSDGFKTCTNCHSGTAMAQVGIITTNIPVDGYVPGSTYTITINASFQNRVEYGFELSVNKGSTSLGGFIHTTSFTKAVITKNATHTGSGISAPSGSRNWTMNWTAPVSGTGTVTFYAAVNATNNNGGSSGDQILTDALDVAEKVVPCTINDLSVTATQSVVCENASTTITVASTESGVSYQLKHAVTNANIGAAQNGTGGTLSFNTGNLTTAAKFKVLATRNASCSLTLTQQPTVDVVTISTPTISTSGSTTFCQGDSVVLTSTQANGYTWSNGETSRSITVKTAGNYSVTASNSNGCSKTSVISVVTVNPLPTATINPSGTVDICTGDSIILKASTASSYTWNTGETTQNIVVKTGGQYSVKVTNQSGCSDQSNDSTTVIVHDIPSAVVQLIGNNPFCEGDTVALSAEPGYTYLWSNGSTDQSISVSSSGKYSVTVTLGICSAHSDSLDLILSTVDSPTFNFPLSTSICPGEDIDLTTNQSYTSYLWSTGSTAATINITNPGEYWVTVSNADGCTKMSDTVTVTQASSLHPTILADNDLSFCSGDSVTLSVGDFDTYLWSTGETSAAIQVKTAGEYSVFVTRNSGCSGQSDSVTVSVFAAPTVAITPIGVVSTCDSLEVSSSGSFASYLWSNGSAQSSIFAKESGLYWLSITDDNGCSAISDTLILTLGKTPNAQIVLNGSIISSNYSAGNQWHKNVLALATETNDSLEIVSDGDYFTVVTDSTGLCSDTSNIIHIVGLGIEGFNKKRLLVYPNPASKTMFISFSNSGQAELSILNYLGKEIKKINTKNGEVELDISKLAAGSYILILKSEGQQPEIRSFNVLNND